MTTPVIAKIDAPSVLAVYGMKQFCQAILALRNCNNMNMVGHQAIRPYFDSSIVLVFSQEFQIRKIVIGAEECLQPPDATLRDMMWIARDNQSGDSGHLRAAMMIDYQATNYSPITVIGK